MMDAYWENTLYSMANFTMRKCNYLSYYSVFEYKAHTLRELFIYSKLCLLGTFPLFK